MEIAPFFLMLPEVRGDVGIDIGCGAGDASRELAYRGARVCGIDLSAEAMAKGIELERADPRGIRYRLGDAEALPFHEHSYDFAIAVMSLDEVARPEVALGEAARVLRPGGFFQLAVAHPASVTAAPSKLPSVAAWVNALVDAGLVIERVAEPGAEEPSGPSLIVRARKPAQAAKG